MEHQHHQVRVHIDQKRYESPNPTTGAALYVLGHVINGMDLYREVNGDHEDYPIDNSAEPIHLKEDEHFHSGQPQTFRIYVNGEEKLVTTKRETFDQIVALAFPVRPTGPNVLFSIGYEDGPRANPVGTLMPGHSVKLKEGMIFNVSATDKS